MTRGKCDSCGFQTITLPGADARYSRPKPPSGFRVGYLVERRSRTWIICAECLTNTLPSNVAA